MILVYTTGFFLLFFCLFGGTYFLWLCFWKLSNTQITDSLLSSEKRRAEAARIREKYPDRIPVRTSSDFSSATICYWCYLWWIMYLWLKQSCSFICFVEWRPVPFSTTSFFFGLIYVFIVLCHLNYVFYLLPLYVMFWHHI